MVTLENTTQLCREDCCLLPHVQPKATARKWWVDRALHNHSLLFENHECQNLQPWCTTWKQQMDKLIHMGHSHNYYVVWPPTVIQLSGASSTDINVTMFYQQYQASAMHHACSYFGHKVSCEHWELSHTCNWSHLSEIERWPNSMVIQISDLTK